MISPDAAPPVMHLAALPDQRAASDRGGPCLADGRRDLDNASFAMEVRRMSSALAEMGIGRGDVVAVVLPNSVELVTIMFAAWRLGAALTPVNPALTSHEARYQVTDSGARLVVADHASLPKVEGGAAPRVRCRGAPAARRRGRPGAAADGARRAGLADLHRWDDRAPEGRHARPRQLGRDSRDDHRLVPDDPGRALPARRAGCRNSCFAVKPCQRSWPRRTHVRRHWGFLDGRICKPGARRRLRG